MATLILIAKIVGGIGLWLAAVCLHGWMRGVVRGNGRYYYSSSKKRR